MKKKLSSIFGELSRVYRVILVGLFTFLALSSPSAVQAAEACRGAPSGASGTLPIYKDGDTHTITMDMSSYDPTKTYYLKVKGGENSDDEAQSIGFKLGTNQTYSNGDGAVTVQGTNITWVITEEEALSSSTFSGENDNHYVFLYEQGSLGKLCQLGTYQTTKNNTGGNCKLYVSQDRRGETCYSSGCMEEDSNMQTKIEVTDLKDAAGQPFNGEIRFVIGVDGGGSSVKDKKAPASNGSASTTFKTDDTGRHTILVEEVRGGTNFPFANCSTAFNVSDFCDAICEDEKEDVSEGATQVDFELCNQVVDSAEKGKCEACFGGSSLGGTNGVWTAIGCIPAKPDSIVRTFMTLGLSLGGGVTLLLILAGAFRLSASQGDPQATKDAKEQITSALIGLVFVIFSITLLRFIGVTILKIPGFGN